MRRDLGGRPGCSTDWVAADVNRGPNPPYQATRKVRWEKLTYSEVMSDAPKSALELALERLKKKDEEAGVEQRTLTEEQRAAIGEARSLCEARIAERRIMHQSQTVSIFDPQELELKREELRRDIAQFESERDAKIRKIRGD